MTVLRKPITAPNRPELKQVELKRRYTALTTDQLQAIDLEREHLCIDVTTMIRILVSEALQARRRERMEFTAHLATYGKPIQQIPLDDKRATAPIHNEAHRQEPG